ncbi:hypothetical protein [Moorena sp. SIO3B2]|nr:hypothetical protein [Moorena sp. SIO3B2]
MENAKGKRQQATGNGQPSIYPRGTPKANKLQHLMLTKNFSQNFNSGVNF